MHHARWTSGFESNGAKITRHTSSTLTSPASRLFPRATQVSYNYYMAMSPVEQRLYISDPEAHQVFKVVQMEQVTAGEDV